MKKYPSINFDEETIRALFGHEAAEDERVERLKEYYIKTEIYNSMRSQIPLFILVGHKGIGKSALIKVLQIDDKEQGVIPILIQPDDILNLNPTTENFLQRIRDWKDGFSKIIFNMLIQVVKNNRERQQQWIENLSTLLLSIIGKKVTDLFDTHADITSSQFAVLFKNTLFKQKKVMVYIDDLDRGWNNTKQDVSNLSAMLNAIRDLCRESENLYFRVALRSDVYYAVRTSDETTDKIDGSVLWQRWSNHEILVMLIKRIETFFGNTVDETLLLKTQQQHLKHYLYSVFEAVFNGRGHWENAPIYRVLMSLIRKRPRDLVKLCTLSAREAYRSHHSLILTNDLERVFSNYSHDRLTDTVNEYRSELPQINDLLLKMKPTRAEIHSGTPSLFTRDALLTKIKNIISMSHLTFKNGQAVTPQSLAAFLYKINFLTARKDLENEIQRIYYDENRYVYNEFSDFGYSYEIHPAYRWALQPDRIQDLFKLIELTE